MTIPATEDVIAFVRTCFDYSRMNWVVVRRPDLMPILADALEEGGYKDQERLDYLRGEVKEIEETNVPPARRAVFSKFLRECRRLTPLVHYELLNETVIHPEFGPVNVHDITGEGAWVAETDDGETVEFSLNDEAQFP